MVDSYCLSKSHTCHITSSLLQRVLKSQNARLHHKHKHLDAGDIVVNGQTMTSAFHKVVQQQY